ncbi:MAG: hypothetical protein L0387_03575 [Acidobacteria bacterium]|nr:hypothetical protein [Acidobacteriota bacterium]MCI0719699.1 hypothetical protein [Acidobacteriota bacterium]
MACPLRCFHTLFFRRSLVLLVSVAFLLVAVLLSRAPQLKELRAAPQEVDGSQHPELIPDETAYRLFFLIASADADSSDLQRSQAQAVVASVLLTESDRTILKQVIQQYRQDLSVLDMEAGNLGTGDKYQRKQDRLKRAISDLNGRLTALGAGQLFSNIQREKRKIKLFPLPTMNKKTAGFMERLFSLPRVYAQGMGPTGSAYTTLTVASAYSQVIATGVTDGSSGCTCHQSDAIVTLTLANGRNASSYVTNQVETAISDAELILGDSDFTDGTITGSTQHHSWCPMAGFGFINTNTSAVGNSRFIQAYYYCDPRDGPCATSLGAATYHRCRPQGDLCDTVTSFKLPGGFSNFPPYALCNVLFIDTPAGDVCIGGSMTASDNCGTSDPRS